jgi:hypothetical protein
MLILYKIHQFRIFQFFFTQMMVKFFLKQHKSTKFDMGFRMVYKLSLQNKLIFFAFFWLRSHLMLKIDQNFFSAKCDNSNAKLKK